jgi:hypothetical protein
MTRLSIVRGWKQVAALLGICERQARRLAKQHQCDMPMPIGCVGTGQRCIPEGKVSELLDWWDKRRTNRRHGLERTGAAKSGHASE